MHDTWRLHYSFGRALLKSLGQILWEKEIRHNQSRALKCAQASTGDMTMPKFSCLPSMLNNPPVCYGLPVTEHPKILSCISYFCTPIQTLKNCSTNLKETRYKCIPCKKYILCGTNERQKNWAVLHLCYHNSCTKCKRIRLENTFISLLGLNSFCLFV